MAKRVCYKGIPLASVSIYVKAAGPFHLSVGAEPGWGKKIFLEPLSEPDVDGHCGALTRDQAAELARRLVQAGIIMDDIEIRDVEEEE